MNWRFRLWLFLAAPAYCWMWLCAKCLGMDFIPVKQLTVNGRPIN